MTYKISSSQLKDMFESPACRTVMSAGPARCAVGKYVDACLGEGSAHRASQLNSEGFLVIPKDVAEFLLEFKGTVGKGWAYFANINDAENGLSLEDNHRQALRLIIQESLDKGFIMLEDEVAQEFAGRAALYDGPPWQVRK